MTLAPPKRGTDGIWARTMHMAIINAAKTSFRRSRSSPAASRQYRAEKGWAYRGMKKTSFLFRQSEGSEKPHKRKAGVVPVCGSGMRGPHCGHAALSSGKQLPVSPALGHTWAPTLPVGVYYRRFWKKRKTKNGVAFPLPV